MHRRPSYRVGTAVVLALLVSLVAAGAALSETSYTDPTGDATGGAPDITGVTVSNDAAGVLTFRVTTIGAPALESSVVLVDLDTDASPATGSLGAEYELVGGTGGAALLKWDGKDFVDSPAPTLSMNISGNVMEFKIGRRDVGIQARFGLGALTVNFDAADAYLGEDDAPDGGSYVYDVVLSQCANGKDDDGDGKIDAKDLGCASSTDNLESDDPVTLRVGKPAVVPAKARAGKFVVVGVPVTRVETGKLIPSGKVKCSARIGTKPLRSSGKMITGFAACGFEVPVKAKGKTVRGTITVTYLGKTKVATFAFKAN